MKVYEVTVFLDLTTIANQIRPCLVKLKSFECDLSRRWGLTGTLSWLTTLSLEGKKYIYLIPFDE